MPLLGPHSTAALRRFEDDPLVDDVQVFWDRLRIGYTTGVVEHWGLNHGAARRLVFPRSGWWAHKPETLPVGGDLAYEADPDGPMWGVSGSEIRKAGFLDQRLLLQRVLARLLREGWVPPVQRDCWLDVDVERLRRADTSRYVITLEKGRTRQCHPYDNGTVEEPPRMSAHTRFLATCASLLLICFTGNTLWGRPEAPKVVHGKSFKLKRAWPAQFREQGTTRPVGPEIVLGSAQFQTETTGDRLRVATKAGAGARRDVKNGQILKFAWEGPDGAKTRELRFLRGADGGWRYHAARAVRFKLGREKLVLVDADANGRFEFEQDGWAAGSNTVLCPLQRRFVLGQQNCQIKELAPDGSSMEVVLSPVPGTPMQLEALVHVNDLRRAHGLTPVFLDEELSQGCTAHAEYLKLHNWTGYTDPHSQDLGDEGSSEQGAQAARASAIRKTSHPQAIDSFYLTYFHRIDLFTANRDRIGVNARVPNISVIYTDAPPLPRENKVPLYDRPTFVPADGAHDVPVRSFMEAPKEPVPDLGSRGFPLMVWFARGGSPTTFGGTLHRAAKRKLVEEPVFIVAPARGVAGLVPEGPLRSKTQYEATFHWGEGEQRESYAIRFETR